MDIIERLKERSVDQMVARGFDGAFALARQNRNAATLDEVVKALDTQETNGGAEFVFTGMSTAVINQVRQALKVSSLLPSIPMPTNPYKVPVELNPATAYLIPENTADTGQTAVPPSQPGTGAITFNAKSIAALTRISKELNQDSIIPMIPFIQSNLMRGLANGLENALINGDVQSTHQDNDTTGSTNVAKSFNGLRRLAIANTWTVDVSTFTLAALRSMRAAMGQYGINPDELVILASNAAYIKMLGWEQVLTLDKYGQNATVLTGELLRVDGIPVIVSPYMRQNLDSTGVNSATGANNTKTAILLVHRSAFALGRVQDVEIVQSDEPIPFRQKTVMADMRADFLPTQPVATEPTVVLGRNITTA
jgi:hypothetical protein